MLPPWPELMLHQHCADNGFKTRQVQEALNVEVAEHGKFLRRRLSVLMEMNSSFMRKFGFLNFQCVQKDKVVDNTGEATISQRTKKSATLDENALENS